MSAVLDEIRYRAEQHPTKIAIRWQGTNSDYCQLLTLITKRASELHSSGVQASNVVAVEAERGLATVVEAAAIWLVGAVVMPLPVHSQPALIHSMVSRVGARYVSRSGTLQATGALESFDFDKTLLILPTSGSTGDPKLVPIGSSSILDFASWAQDQFGLSERRTLSFAPQNFDLSLLEIWAPLISGGSVEMVSETQAQNPRALRDLLRETNADLIQGVPFVFKSLASPIDEEPLQMKSVRDVISTGSPINKETRLLISDVFPAAVFHNVYGSTETNNSFMATFDRHQFLSTDTLPIGNPLPGVDASIDESADHSDALGELLVRTPFMMNGYIAANGQVEPLEGYFRTGDIVHRDDEGTYHLETRSSRIVKVRGNRVNLDQVESVLEDHPAVQEAVVFFFEDAPESTQIVALVRVPADARPSVLGLRVHCSKALPPFALPSVFHLSTDAFPRTSSDKVDRRASALIYHRGTIHA